MSWFKFMLTSESDHVADLTILAPVSGVILPIEDVPDVVFSEKIIGDGVASLYLNDELALTARMYHSLGTDWELFSAKAGVTWENIQVYD